MEISFNNLPEAVTALLSKIEALTGLVKDIQPLAIEKEVPLTVKELAKILNCSASTIQHNSSIPSHKSELGKRYYYLNEVNAWIKEGKPKASPTGAMSIIRPVTRGAPKKKNLNA